MIPVKSFLIHAQFPFVRHVWNSMCLGNIIFFAWYPFGWYVNVLWKARKWKKASSYAWCEENAFCCDMRKDHQLLNTAEVGQKLRCFKALFAYFFSISFRISVLSLAWSVCFHSQEMRPSKNSMVFTRMCFDERGKLKGEKLQFNE